MLTWRGVAAAAGGSRRRVCLVCCAEQWMVAEAAAALHLPLVVALSSLSACWGALATCLGSGIGNSAVEDTRNGPLEAAFTRQRTAQCI